MNLKPFPELLEMQAFRIRRDYQLMRDMYLNEPVSFDEILSTLTQLEHRINQANLVSLALSAADSER